MFYFSPKKHHNTLFINILLKNNSRFLFLFLFSLLINFFFTSIAFAQSQDTTKVDLIDSVQINTVESSQISDSELDMKKDSISVSSLESEEINSKTDSVVNSEVYSELDSTLNSTLDSTSIHPKIKTNFSIGFRGGITRGQFEIANQEQNDRNSAGVGSVVSFFINYKLNSHFSIQPEVALGRYRSNNTLYKIALVQGTVDYSISTIDFNLLGIYSYSITNWCSVSAEAGLSVARLYSSFGNVVAPNIRVAPVYDVNSKNQFEKLNYGALIGINPSFHFKNVTLQTSVRYRHGFNNINTFDYTLNRYLNDSQRTIKTRDILFQVGFLIPIYKKATNGKSEVGIRD